METEIAEPEEVKEARIKIAKLISAEIDEIDKRRVQNPEQRLRGCFHKENKVNYDYEK